MSIQSLVTREHSLWNTYLGMELLVYIFVLITKQFSKGMLFMYVLPVTYKSLKLLTFLILSI